MLEYIVDIFYKKEYKIIKETIYFLPNFNDNIDNYIKQICKCKKIVFMNNKNFFDINTSIDKIKFYTRDCKKVHSQFNNCVDNLPISLEEIYFGYSFNKPVDNLPKNLIRIFFDNDFNQLVDKLPDKLKEIHFGWHFNQCIDNLPNNLEKIYFEGFFHSSIDNIPDNVVSLSFFCYRTQKINKLPKNLQYLHFSYGSKFNNDIPQCDNLKCLELGQHYKSKFTINNKLETLICYFDFKDKINLPESLKSLALFHTNQYLIDNLPNSIEELTFGWWWDDFNLDNLPNSIKKIDLERIDKKVSLNLNNLPNSLEIIKLPRNFNDEILKIPSNLKIVYCQKEYKFVKKLKKNKIKILFY